MKTRVESFRIAFKLLIVVVLTSLYLLGPLVNAENNETLIIMGTVTGEDGAIEGAEIRLTIPGVGSENNIQETRSGYDGRYIFQNASQATEYYVNVSFNGISHTKKPIMVNETLQANFDFYGRLEIRVLFPNNTVIDGVELQLFNSFHMNEKNVTTDLTGYGLFEPLDVNDQYYVSFYIKQIPYSMWATFENSNITEKDIVVYEATTSDEDFIVRTNHIIISKEGSELSFQEIVSHSNTGNRVFNTSWLKGWIPPDSYDIIHDTMDCCIQFLSGGEYLFDPMEPVFPLGETQLVLSYKLEADTSTRILEKKIVYDTEMILFLIKKTPDVTAEAIQGLEMVGIGTYGENEYYQFEAVDLQAGDVVQIKLTLKISLIENISRNNNTWGLLILILPLAWLTYLYLSNKQKEDQETIQDEQFDPVPTPQTDSSSNLSTELVAVEKVLEKLTTDFKTGKISEETFNKVFSKYDKKSSSIIERIQNKEKNKEEKT